jgi:hypothetical protein
MDRIDVTASKGDERSRGAITAIRNIWGIKYLQLTTVQARGRFSPRRISTGIILT